MARRITPTKKQPRSPSRGKQRAKQPADDIKEQPAPRVPNLIITPRNPAQEDYLEALEDERNSYVFAVGPAGSGKSMLATQYAIKCLIAGQIKKIVITRPTVSAGEDIGFLPGTLLAKLTPWCLPVIDVFKEVYPVKIFEKMIESEVVEIAPLGMMRGRTFKDAIVIVDEAQNMLPAQMKMALTRLGNGSRMFITGDLKQHDRGFEENGLLDFLARMGDALPGSMEVCHFGPTDIVRHPAIEDVLRLYGDA